MPKKEKQYKNQYIFNCTDSENCGHDWSEEIDVDLPQLPDNRCPNCDLKGEMVAKYENVLDFMDYYTPITNNIHPEEEDRFETFGKDLQFVQEYDQNHVWTVVDGDNGVIAIGKGYHYVNRIYYIITEESHEGDDEHYYY